MKEITQQFRNNFLKHAPKYIIYYVQYLTKSVYQITNSDPELLAFIIDMSKIPQIAKFLDSKL
jgi:hypothetical protein